MLTLLKAEKGIRLTKTFTPSGVQSYGNAKYFEHSSVDVPDINTLALVLTSLEGETNTCVIRGQFNPQHSSPEYVLGSRIQRKKVLFNDKPLPFLMLDVDNYPTSLPPVEAIQDFIATQLPKGFHDRTFYYQLSASYGTRGKEGVLKAHLWFWLDTPYDSPTLRGWAKTIPALDYSVYNTVHIHYTSNPVFMGVPAPTVQRSGLVEGLLESVKLSITPATHAPEFIPEYVIDEAWPLSRIQLEILPNISPDIPNDEWVKVGMALHHQGSGGSEWLQAFDTWSALGSSYDEDVCAVRWESFYRDSGSKVGIGTLLHMANISRSSVAADDEFEALTIPPVKANPQRFNPVQAALFSQGTPPSWLIKSLIPRAELVVLFGASGSGKSFVALDIGAAIALGQPWRGLRTKKGTVVYIAAEGAGGFRNRLQAYSMEFKTPLEDLDFYVISVAPNFMLKQDALDLTSAVAPLQPSLIIVDTWAQTTPGANENSGEDMGKALGHCNGLYRATGATILLVHHSGKNASMGARGWSGLRAAADAELEMLRNGDDRVLSSTKQKDGEDGAEYGCKLRQVNLGLDEDGDVISSCVVEASEVTAANGKKALLMGDNERLIVKMAGDLVSLDGILPDVNTLLDRVSEQIPYEKVEGKRDRRRELVGRALKKLLERGLLAEIEGRIEVV